jgi:imidazole glycerol-phosphate synthase subunit HisH
VLLLIDNKTSNLNSVRNAFQRIGVSVEQSSGPADVEKASALVLPGVGAYEKGMAGLRAEGLIDSIRRRVLEAGMPILGICLGMQMLATSSEEHGDHAGLDLISGRVKRLAPNDPAFRVPNIGWCDVVPTRASVLFPAGVKASSYYHVHSYFMECDNPEDSSAVMDFSGKAVTVAVERGNVFGTQFHPEKSQDAGLDMFERFVNHLKVQGHL